MTEAKQRRWYDKDPLLSMAMETLEQSSDEDQIRLALHLIKVINEHNMEHVDVRDARHQRDLAQGAHKTGSARWYDLDQTLKTSIEMLRACDPAMQKIIARQMAQKLNELMGADDGDDNA